MILFDDFNAFTHFIILRCTICESRNYAAIQIDLCYVMFVYFADLQKNRLTVAPSRFTTPEHQDTPHNVENVSLNRKCTFQNGPAVFDVKDEFRIEIVTLSLKVLKIGQ